MKNVTLSICEEFHCIGGDCPDTCCAGWKINIDKATDAYYQSVTGDFGELLQSKIDRSSEPHHFIMDKNLRCPFLREDNLCSIYRNLGEDKLSETCTQFPRGQLKMTNLVFSYLSFACPEMVRMAFSSKDPLSLSVTETESTPTAPSQNSALEDFYLESLMVGISIAQNRSFSIRERLALCILYYQQQQHAIDYGTFSSEYSTLFSNQEICHQLISAESLPASDILLRLRLFRLICLSIKIGTEEPHLMQIYNAFLSIYQQHDTNWLIDNLEDIFSSFHDLDIESEHLLVYLYLRYTACCSSTGVIASAMIFIVVFYVSYQCFLAFATLEKGSSLDQNERIRIISRLSRLYEHNSAEFPNLLQLLMEHDLDRPESLFQLI